MTILDHGSFLETILDNELYIELIEDWHNGDMSLLNKLDEEEIMQYVSYRLEEYGVPAFVVSIRNDDTKRFIVQMANDDDWHKDRAEKIIKSGAKKVVNNMIKKFVEDRNKGEYIYENSSIVYLEMDNGDKYGMTSDARDEAAKKFIQGGIEALHKKARGFKEESEEDEDDALEEFGDADDEDDDSKDSEEISEEEELALLKAFKDELEKLAKNIIVKVKTMNDAIEICRVAMCSADEVANIAIYASEEDNAIYIKGDKKACLRIANYAREFEYAIEIASDAQIAFINEHYEKICGYDEVERLLENIK